MSRKKTSKSPYFSRLGAVKMTVQMYRTKSQMLPHHFGPKPPHRVSFCDVCTHTNRKSPGANGPTREENAHTHKKYRRPTPPRGRETGRDAPPYGSRLRSELRDTKRCAGRPPVCLSGRRRCRSVTVAIHAAHSPTQSVTHPPRTVSYYSPKARRPALPCPPASERASQLNSPPIRHSFTQSLDPSQID